MMIKVQEKRLPLAPPPVLVYVDYSYSLSILRNYDKTDAWFYCNYVQLFFQKKDEHFRGKLKFFITDGNGRVWYPSLPWLNYQTLQRSMVKALNLDIIELIIKSLDTNYYIMLNWDEFFVPEGLTGCESHFSHKTLIYGYNLEEECFFSVGFKKTTKYEYSKISFADFKRAYHSEINDENTAYHDTEICLMKMNDNFSFNFDLDTLLQQLHNFYLSVNPLTNYSTHFNTPYDVDYFNKSSSFIFGMDSYKCLQSYIQLMPLYKDNYLRPIHTLWKHGDSNFQPFQTLWEHKKIMLDRIAFLKKNKYLPEESNFEVSYKQIEIKAKTLRDLFIKYEKTENDNLITEMLAVLTDIYEEERVVLGNMIEELHNSPICTGQ